MLLNIFMNIYIKLIQLYLFFDNRYIIINSKARGDTILNKDNFKLYTNSKL